MHGWTVCPPCTFREVCQAIAKYGFIQNPLPIIVSLEVHADVPQQRCMVDIMEEEWGDLLLTEPLEGYDPQFRVPTLADLQHRILVKVKKHYGSRNMAVATTADIFRHLRHKSGEALNRLTPETRRSGLDLYVGRDRDSGRHLSRESLVSIGSTGSAATQNWDAESCISTESAGESATSEQRAITECLGRLAVYTHGERFKGWQQANIKKPSHIFSISEKRIPALYASDPEVVFAHNKSFFMRAYPNVVRIDSSNPDPADFWRKGVQMVAMNWQRNDYGMMINHAMFADEDGWVPKPPGFRSTNKDTLTHLDACVWKTMKLRITLHAGHNVAPSKTLPSSSFSSPSSSSAIGSASMGTMPAAATSAPLYPSSIAGPPPDPAPAVELDKTVEPVVRVTVHTEAQQKDLEKNSRGVTDTGGKKPATVSLCSPAGRSQNPDWGDEGCVMDFEPIPRVTDKLSYIRFTVRNHTVMRSNPLLSWQCIRLDRLQSGFRFIPLLNAQAVPCGFLLVTIDVSFSEVPRPEHMPAPE
ncbi:hypothetical protein TD95_005350 [Thielaviopsis punctulata]|uniref:Phosphoinositide phospholipase C n=1 Tax=Thielaviopsis punctulata TaxID=72032 RepID=A0A0F4ZIF1_9PEZI|nr:hypothetical protein TD95_005350 [Thielaviopsis punctulata]